jgi:serine/threonine protein kinase
MQPTKSGLSLDQFELGRKLGKGRFGDVFMAREIKTGFALAIKIINKK